MKTDKVFAIFATLLIGLSGLGYAFAHWSDSVTVEGEVRTGITVGGRTFGVIVEEEVE